MSQSLPKSISARHTTHQIIKSTEKHIASNLLEKTICDKITKRYVSLWKKTNCVEFIK